ncbi:MAG: carboxypeptidase-like regulatory domain-containing protein [Acidobacteriota bacterium]
MAACVVLATLIVPAHAQVTSGTISGTIKDAQRGVIPGATVTLVSAAKGTRSTPVVTSVSGDFVFANVRQHQRR